MRIPYVRSITLTIVALMGPFLFAAAKPLVQSVTVINRQTVAFRITTDPANQKVTLAYRDELGLHYLTAPQAAACFSPTVSRPAFSFDNDTPQAWTIRLLPREGASEGGLCHELECATNLKELKGAGLCDRSADESKDCVSSAAALGSCFGPECNAVRTKCANKLDASRNCTISVADVVAACLASSCATAREVGAKQPSPANAVPLSEYSRSTKAITLPAALNQRSASESFPSAGFESESIPEQGPYKFRLEPATGDVLRLDVSAATAGGNCPLVPAVRERTTQYAAFVPLDNTGVGSWVYLNPRNPACLRCDNQTLLPLAFYNRTSDRSFSVAVELPAEVIPHLGDFERKNCTAGKPCKVTRTVQPNNSTIFSIDLLQAVPEGTLLRFQVGFYDETEKPANPTAFIRVSDKVTEPESALQTTIGATVGGVLDPFIAAPPDKITDEKTLTADGQLVDGPDGRDDATGFKPCYVGVADYKKDAEPALCIGNRVYDGKHARHYTGSVRVDLTKTLGSRADAAASVLYRQTDFGIDDGNPLKLSTYTVNVYGLQGLMLRFGRLTWAAPANGIAISEKGDGYRVSFANFSLTHVIKRESAGTIADPPNRDNRSIIFQVKSLPLNFTTPGVRALKLLDVTAVRGEDKASHTYKTVGGEVFYAFTNIGCGNDETPCSFDPQRGERRNWGTIAGSLAGFYSTRHHRPGSTIEDGKGRVGLLTATWTPTIRKTPQGAFEAVRTYTLQLGNGSSDKPSTTGTREDYVGESAAYAPDLLFLPIFGGKIDAKGHILVGRSLSNRTFTGFQFVDNTASPLEWIAKLLQVESDINSRSTTLRFRQYRFGREIYPDSGRDVGYEFSGDFTIEAPKGVKFSLGGGYFQPGKGVQPVIPKGVWLITTGVVLSF